MDLQYRLNRQFTASLERDGVAVIADDGNKYKIICKQYSPLHEDGKMEIGYPQSYNWHKGTYYFYHNHVWLITNIEDYESDTYYNAVAVRTDASWTIHDKTYYIKVGNFVGGFGTTVGGDVILNLVNGNIAIYAQDFPFLAIDDIIHTFGMTYKVKNLMRLDGIINYYLTATQDQDFSSYFISDNTKDKTIALTKDNPTFDIDTDLTYTTSDNASTYLYLDVQRTFKSSDTNICTVDDDGVVTALNDGTATITCTYTTTDTHKTATANFSVTVTGFASSGGGGGGDTPSPTNAVIAFYSKATTDNEQIILSDDQVTHTERVLRTDDGTVNTSIIPTLTWIVTDANGNDVTSDAGLNYTYKSTSSSGMMLFKNTVVGIDTTKYKYIQFTATYSDGVVGTSQKYKIG